MERGGRVLRGENILCFAPDPWSNIWRNRHQIMSLLAESNQVLYIEPRPYLRDLAQRLRRGEVTRAEWRAPRLGRVKAGLHTYRPPLYAPRSAREPWRSLTQALRQADLGRVMRKLGMARPLLWLYRPDMDDLPGHCGEALVIYHIVDEYTGYTDLAPARAAAIARRERALIARADLVLVTAETLLHSKGGLNPNTHWVPNGVDYERFAAAVEAGLPPLELEGLPHPRLAYVGAINDKIDTALLLAVARAYPQAALALVGPVGMTTAAGREGIAALRAQPNVRFIGQVAVERVSVIMAGCDLGLLPYQHNMWTENIHPLKMYEYLASGLPVVSTDIPAVRAERDLIAIAADSAGFVAALGAALAQPRGALRAVRQERAARNTWRQRVEQISLLIEATQQHKGRTSCNI